MLKIVNKLSPFFENCYRNIGVREYGKLIKVSPPTASKLLKDYKKEGLLESHEERRYLLFQLNNYNKDVIDISHIYWRKQLKPLINQLEKRFVQPTIVLFGSAAKAELKADSDIDIALLSTDKKEISLKDIEKKIKRTINLHHFKNLKNIKNTHLRNNIINGYLLSGRLRGE